MRRGKKKGKRNKRINCSALRGKLTAQFAREKKKEKAMWTYLTQGVNDPTKKLIFYSATYLRLKLDGLIKIWCNNNAGRIETYLLMIIVTTLIKQDLYSESEKRNNFTLLNHNCIISLYIPIISEYEVWNVNIFKENFHLKLSFQNWFQLIEIFL